MKAESTVYSYSWPGKYVCRFFLVKMRSVGGRNEQKQVIIMTRNLQNIWLGKNIYREYPALEDNQWKDCNCWGVFLSSSLHLTLISLVSHKYFIKINKEIAWMIQDFSVL